MTTGTLVTPLSGGTGVANANGNTITIGGPLVYSGAFITTFTVTAGTSLTLPTSGTLATTGGTVATATNLAGGGAGQIPFQSGAGATAFSANLTFTGGNLLTVTGGITASGDISMGSGGTGSTNSTLTLNGGSASNTGAGILFKRNSVTTSSIGNAGWEQTGEGNLGDLDVYMATGLNFNVYASASAHPQLAVNTSGIAIGPNIIQAASATIAAATVTLSRASDGVWQMGTTAANALGSLNLANLTASGTVKSGGFTVATLPAGATGQIAYVTDQLTVVNAKGVAPTGGGAVVCYQNYNGSGWVGI